MSGASSRGRPFWLALFLCILTLTLYDAVSFLLLGWERSQLLSVAFAALFATALGSAIFWARTELRQIRKLKSTVADRAMADALRAADAHDRAMPFAEKLLSQLPITVNAGERFRASVIDTHSDREVLDLFAQIVLR